ncbi:MAG: SprT family zinc-dependent metalloprotease [Phycisphaerae bacterium]|jgi:hypothetical protein
MWCLGIGLLLAVLLAVALQRSQEKQRTTESQRTAAALSQLSPLPLEWNGWSLAQRKKWVVERTAEWWRVVRLLYPQLQGDGPSVTFSARMSRTQGYAKVQTAEIRYSELVLSTRTPVEIDELIAHEVAHLVTFQLDPTASAHGPRWKAVMKTMGQVPARLARCEGAHDQERELAWREQSTQP